MGGAKEYRERASDGDTDFALYGWRRYRTTLTYLRSY